MRDEEAEVRRELLELQVDGTAGSAVSGLRDCAVQHRVSTPLPVWNPDLPDPIEYQALWSDVPDNMAFDNGFKAEWELFLKCASEDRPFAWDLFEGAKGVQLADLAARLNRRTLERWMRAGSVRHCGNSVVSNSCALQLTSRTELAGSVPNRQVPDW